MVVEVVVAALSVLLSIFYELKLLYYNNIISGLRKK